MTLLNVQQAIPVELAALATLTVADGWDLKTVPFNGVIRKVSANIGVNGTTSGNTDFVVARTRAAVEADLWAVATGVGRIAHDSAALYQEFEGDNAAIISGGSIVKAGDTLRLDINAVPTAASNLRVTLWIVPTDN